jgi:hypothetical protein
MTDLAGDPDCARRALHSGLYWPAPVSGLTEVPGKAFGKWPFPWRLLFLLFFAVPHQTLSPPPRPRSTAGTASKRRIRCHYGNFTVAL